ncbi:MAG: ABC transporter ATP-binding protein [Bdellovibrio sp.]|nr:MAG: ABC transporter ATP-binding protein [Bdellovibrio sp.]
MITVRHLSKFFRSQFYERRKQVLFDISFEVKARRTTGFIGVNGSGKTTTLKCILGFIFPDAGEVTFFAGEPLNKKIRSKLGYLPERPYLYEHLTALEFLRFHWNIAGGRGDFQAAAMQALGRVNLQGIEDQTLRQFSKGMMQRIGLAQALLLSPEILILDEPTSGLDPDGRFMMKEIIRQERARGTTIFFSSHFLNDVQELADDLVVIEKGKVLYTGPTMNLIAQNRPRYRLGLRDTRSGDLSEELCEVEDLSRRLNELHQRGQILTSVANEHVALEVAFQTLRKGQTNAATEAMVEAPAEAPARGEAG